MKRILGAAAILAAAGILLAQQKTVLGTVTKFKVDTLELGIQPDSGEPVLLKVGPETQVVQIPPGERDLRQAKPAKVTDIMLGDRIMVSFVDGLTDARRIVLIAADDIAAATKPNGSTGSAAAFREPSPRPTPSRSSSRSARPRGLFVRPLR